MRLRRLIRNGAESLKAIAALAFSALVGRPDLLAVLLGLAFIVVGVGRIYEPAAWIVAGSILIALAVWPERGRR